MADCVDNVFRQKSVIEFLTKEGGTVNRGYFERFLTLKGYCEVTKIDKNVNCSQYVGDNLCLANAMK